MTDACLEVLNVLYWRAPPLLIEWGCQLLRRQEKPTAAERWWQLAALSVAQRAEDPQFLIGDTLRDAMSVALVSAAEPDRRQLVVFFTDGSDSSSTTSDDVLMTVAQRTRATLAFVVPGSFRTQPIINRSVPGAPAIPTSLRRFGTYPPLLTALARETGGSVLPVGGQVDLGAAFRRVLGDFRTTYVLYFTPRGVETGGYHTIEVRTARDGTQVQARRGYFGS